MRLVVAAFCGALFGLGLVISGMTDTAKVQGFLDIFGAWDATLIFVMAGAMAPMAIAWRWASGHPVTALGTSIPAQGTRLIDRRLLLGSGLFGLGWGLVGLCPGPAMAVAGVSGLPGLVFLAAMVTGMVLARRLGAAAPLPGAPGSPCPPAMVSDA